MRKSLKEQLSEKLNIPIARSKGIMTKKKMTVPITEQSFAIGKVLEMDLDATDGIALKDDYDKRRKYFVVLAEIKEDSIVGAFLINSEINKKVITTKELLDCQFPLNQEDYPDFLDYDSFLDCSEIFEIDKIKINRMGLELGELVQSDIELVKDTIERTEAIPPKQKKKFGFEDKS